MNTQNNTNTNTTNTNRNIFSQEWEKAPKVDYDGSWANGTGYMDGAVNSPLVNEERPMVAFTDKLNRKGIIVYHGMVDGKTQSSVIFERFSNGENGILVSNRSSSIKKLIPNCDSSLSQKKAARILSAKVADLDNPSKLQQVGKWMLEDHLQEGYYYLDSTIEQMASFLGVDSGVVFCLVKKIECYHRANRWFCDAFDSGKAFEQLQREIDEL